MPSKGHKIAAKQSKLNTRRKRVKSQHQVGSPNPTSGISESTSDPNLPKTAAENKTTDPILPNDKSTEVSQENNIQHTQKINHTSVLTSNFLGGELLQIAVLSGFMVLILVALTFVLN